MITFLSHKKVALGDWNYINTWLPISSFLNYFDCFFAACFVEADQNVNFN